LFPENPDGDWGQRSDAAFAALNFIWHYQYTQDHEFLRTNAYPYLREVGDFWVDYLKLESGRYVIHNDSIHESSGADMNPLLSLGLVRTLFTNLLAMSEELGLDSDRRPKWRDISARLSAFPLQERGGKTVFRYSEKGTAWVDGNTLGIHHIFPAGAIGLDSAPKLLETSRNTIAAMGRWDDDPGHPRCETGQVGIGPSLHCRDYAWGSDRAAAAMRLIHGILAAALLAGTAAPAAVELRLTAPQECQVIQRGSANRGTLRIAGQSNAANHGEERQTPQTGRVAVFDGTHWRLAADPQPGASGSGGRLPASLR
jgi:hypothetical protein